MCEIWKSSKKLKKSSLAFAFWIFKFAFLHLHFICKFAKNDFTICTQHYVLCRKEITGGAVMYYVYKHTVPNGKVYIGFTGEEPKYRWNGGLGYQQNKTFFKDILKYGWDNISHEIINVYDTEEAARDEEAIQIYQHKSMLPHFGYNILVRNHAQCKTVAQYTKDGKHIATYNSLTDAARATGVNLSTLCLCCKGKQGTSHRKTAGGFVWKYEKEGE